MPQDFSLDPFARSVFTSPGVEATIHASMGEFAMAPPAPLVARVLVALDASPAAFAALAWAGRLAADWSAQAIVAGIRVPAFTPRDEGGFGWWTRDADAQRNEAQQRAALDEAMTELSGIGVRATLHDATGSPAEEILRAAKLHGSDLIALGAASRPETGSPRVGRVAEAVLRGAEASVLLARAPPGSGPIVASGEAMRLVATRLARRARLPVLSLAATGAEAASRARDAKASLLVVPRDADGLAAARIAACSVLVVEA